MMIFDFLLFEGSIVVIKLILGFFELLKKDFISKSPLYKQEKAKDLSSLIRDKLVYDFIFKTIYGIKQPFDYQYIQLQRIKLSKFIIEERSEAKRIEFEKKYTIFNLEHNKCNVKWPVCLGSNPILGSNTTDCLVFKSHLKVEFKENYFFQDCLKHKFLEIENSEYSLASMRSSQLSDDINVNNLSFVSNTNNIIIDPTDFKSFLSSTFHNYNPNNDSIRRKPIFIQPIGSILNVYNELLIVREKHACGQTDFNMFSGKRKESNNQEEGNNFNKNNRSNKRLAANKFSFSAENLSEKPNNDLKLLYF